MSEYTMQTTASAKANLYPLPVVFCSPPPRESRVSGHTWRWELHAVMAVHGECEIVYFITLPLSRASIVGVRGSQQAPYVAMTKQLRSRPSKSIARQGTWEELRICIISHILLNTILTLLANKSSTYHAYLVRVWTSYSNKYRLKTKSRNKSRGEIFCGIKFSLYFVELYEVLKGIKPPNYGAP